MLMVLLLYSARNPSRHLVGVVCSTGGEVDAYRRLPPWVTSQAGSVGCVAPVLVVDGEAALSCGRSDAPLTELRETADLSSLVSSAGL